MDDGLEPLAPIDPPAQMAATGRVLHGALAPVTAAMGGVLVAMLVIMTGPFADTLAVALGRERLPWSISAPRQSPDAPASRPWTWPR
jgi:hypothetical protein